ncbi:conserved hypothetical protein [metagenome]|uniref:DUF559 domain-containing protein n=1 Tax=metagenome TaxID=256318 RepID=A0A2P2CFB8_9ZZZZ
MTRIDSLPLTPFTARQALQAGLSRTRLRAALQDHLIVRLLRGVYLRADVEPTELVRAQAAALVTGPHMVVCDRTAAWIHGVRTFDYWELDVVVPLELYALRRHEPTRRSGCDGGTRDLQPEDWFELGGVRITTPARTAMDLGCKLSRRRALAAMDALMRGHAFTELELRRMLPRYHRRRGVVQLRQLVPLVDPRAESPSESWTRLEIIDNGLPAPTPQYWVLVDGVPTYRLDLAYPHARIAIEYDGVEFHSDADARANDEERRAWLRAHGWTVIVLDLHSFSVDAIVAWIGLLRAALRLTP